MSESKEEQPVTFADLVKTLSEQSRGFTKEETEAHKRLLDSRSVVVKKLYDI